MNCEYCGRFMLQVKPFEPEYDPLEVVVCCENCDFYGVDEKATEKNWEEIDKEREQINNETI